MPFDRGPCLPRPRRPVRRLGLEDPFAHQRLEPLERLLCGWLVHRVAPPSDCSRNLVSTRYPHVIGLVWHHPSKRTSPAPLPSTALNRNSSRFVFSDLYRITVPRLCSTLHSHTEHYRLWSVLPAHDFLAGCIAVSEGATMQHLVYRLRRIPLPRRWVNKPA